jgi:anti-sigma-K factor RskA
VAILVARDPPDFSERPVIAVLRDAGLRPAWEVRLARSAHLIALDSLDPPPPPAGRAYQLWLVTPGAAAQPLALLPLAGRKVVAETPANIRRLAGHGELQVTLEAGNGGLAGSPSGPPVYRGRLTGRSDNPPDTGERAKNGV